jgi:hypothetical protein
MAGRKLPVDDELIASEAERAKLELQKQEEQRNVIKKVSEEARTLINQGKSDVNFK